ncbi:MAG: lipoprotein-releasing ABC transporter ATP-binding protein LolD [Gammaproteobacteria bacterium]
MNDPLPTRTPILSCQGLVKHFQEMVEEVHVLEGVDLEIHETEQVAVVGVSGSGKSTLLHLLGGLEKPTAGEVRVADTELSGISETERGNIRNRYIGFIYQFHHLLREFTAIENVAMPLLIRKDSASVANEKATQLLSKVGLQHRLHHKPSEMSGGERQRAAVARALITQPGILLADEPTGNLDRQSGSQVYDIMLGLNRELGTALLVVTHDPDLAGRMDRVYRLEDGHLSLS